MGHLNVRGYVSRFDEASWTLLARLGLGAARLRAESRGMMAVQQNLTYEREVLAGEAVEIESRVVRVGRSAMCLVHGLHTLIDRTPVARCEITAVHVDLSSRRATELPADVRARLTRVFPIAGEERAVPAPSTCPG